VGGDWELSVSSNDISVPRGAACGKHAEGWQGDIAARRTVVVDERAAARPLIK
jgi:hypothetical protein